MPEHKIEGLEPTAEWDACYWGMNLPLQMWNQADGSYRVLNYMPRKEYCQYLESDVTAEGLPRFCKNAAAVLRNLALQFEKLAELKHGYIYYPDANPNDIGKPEE